MTDYADSIQLNIHDADFWNETTAKWTVDEDGDSALDFNVLYSWWCNKVNASFGQFYDNLELVIRITTFLGTSEGMHRESVEVGTPYSCDVEGTFSVKRVTTEEVQTFLTAVFQGMQASAGIVHTNHDVALLVQHEMMREAFRRGWIEAPVW